MSDIAPIVVGVLLDHPGPESPMIGEMRRVVDPAVGRGRLDRPVTFVTEVSDGLPRGTAAAVTAAFHRLVAQDALIIMGPTITDNGLVVRDLADQVQVPCCNWTGSDQTRSEWMFHYQIGSLEEEPHLLANHLEAEGCQRLVLVQDQSPIGARYGQFFEDAVMRLGLQITAKSLISPVTTDLTATVADLSPSGDGRAGIPGARPFRRRARPGPDRRRLAAPGWWPTPPSCSATHTPNGCPTGRAGRTSTPGPSGIPPRRAARRP